MADVQVKLRLHAPPAREVLRVHEMPIMTAIAAVPEILD